MQHKPVFGFFDYCRFFVMACASLSGFMAYAELRPDKMVGIAILFVVGWMFIDKLEALEAA